MLPILAMLTQSGYFKKIALMRNGTLPAQMLKTQNYMPGTATSPAPGHAATIRIDVIHIEEIIEKPTQTTPCNNSNNIYIT